MRVGIVLGGGGPFGWAYHLGVLDGIQAALGCTLSHADRVVATSAGSHIASAVLSSGSTDNVLDVITTPPDEETRRRMEDARKAVLQNPLRSLRPMSPRLVARARDVGAVTALVGTLPPGVFPTAPLRRFDLTPPTPWPSGLWVPSVRIDDGQIVVFGRDRTDVSLADAIEASSAVPGMFRPKVIAGARYIDGAVASATHADLLVGERLDVVIVSSPMTKPKRGVVRARAMRQLTEEVEDLQADGATVVVISPTAGAVEAGSGFPRQEPEAGARIVDSAREQTIAALDQHARQRS